MTWTNSIMMDQHHSIGNIKMKAIRLLGRTDRLTGPGGLRRAASSNNSFGGGGTANLSVTAASNTVTVNPQNFAH